MRFGPAKRRTPKIFQNYLALAGGGLTGRLRSWGCADRCFPREIRTQLTSSLALQYAERRSLHIRSGEAVVLQQSLRLA